MTNALHNKTTWSCPELEDVPTATQVTLAAAQDSRLFLTTNHHDSWTPSWKGFHKASPSTTSHHDFVMA